MDRPPAAAATRTEPYGTAPPSDLPGAPAGAKAAPVCDRCGSVPATPVQFERSVGMVVVRRTETSTARLCRSCGLAAFRSFTDRTLVLGWWGLVAFVANWGALARNLAARGRLRALPEPQPGPTTGRDDTRLPADPGRPMVARAGVWVTVALLAVVAVGAGRVVRGPGSPGSTRVADLPIARLQVGDCFDVPARGGGELEMVAAVPCAEVHEYEVISQHTLPHGPGAAYPGDDEVTAASEELCAVVFPAFVGTPHEESALDVATITPTPTSWTQGDRGLTCAIYDPGGPVAGSLRDARR